MKRFCVCIPTYNNEATVADVVDRCLRLEVGIVLVIDDGSRVPVESCLKSEASRAALATGRLLLHRWEQNAGKGPALLRGFQIAAQLGALQMATIDADGQHFPEDLPAVMAQASEPDSLVIGARKMDALNSPFLSRLGRYLCNGLVGIATGVQVRDSQSGFRIYPVNAVLAHDYEGNRYEFELEVLIRLLWSGVPFRAAPVRVFYPRAAERVSHFRKGKDTARIGRIFCRLVLKRLGGSLVVP